jgi:uncharacterized protein YgfB (UPF0149 family)
MGETVTNTDLYEQLGIVLELAQLEVTASEVHGIVVGAIVNHLKTGQTPDLLKLIEPNYDSTDGRFSNLLTQVQDLYRQTSDGLFDDSENFSLLMPDDDDALGLRTDELASWCKGYVLGLLHNDKFSIDQLPSNGPEIVRDFIDISEAAAGDADEDEEDWALAELQEYVKVGAQLVFEFVYSEKVASAPKTDKIQ